LEISEKYDFFSAFFISSLTSNYYHFKGLHKKISPADDHDVWYYRFIASGKEYDLDVDSDEAADNTLTIFINYRVLDSEGRLLGVTGVGVKVDGLASLVTSYLETFNRKVYLADADGIIQVHENRSLIDSVKIADMEGLGAFAEKILSRSAGYENSEFAREGDRILLNVRYIEKMDWYLFVEHNETASLKTARMNFLRSISIGLCATIFIILLTLITLNYYQRRVDELIDTDELTGLANRRKLEKQFAREVYYYSREERSFCLLLIDLDGFKEVNDILGHVEGDNVLRTIAAEINRIIRPTDTFARWGGDEFALLVASGTEDGLHMSERILACVANIDWPNKAGDDDPRYYVTASCGLAEFKGGEKLDALLLRADKALYKCKDQGGNCTLAG
jgi:diguanylate cyclase (GGDEF)-like protein